MPLQAWELVGRLCLAAALGGIIGLEREAHGRPAGFRTHILVCVGSALVVLVSMYGFMDATERFEPLYYDVSRLAAQVVSGVGFLGAGTILREGATVRGLTTAASLWTVAGIGLAAGTGMYVGALAATLLVMLALMFLGRVERRWVRPGYPTLCVVMEDRPGQLGLIASVIGRHHLNIKEIDFEELQGGKVQLQFALQAAPGDARMSQVLAEISSLEGVSQASARE